LRFGFQAQAQRIQRQDARHIGESLVSQGGHSSRRRALEMSFSLSIEPPEPLAFNANAADVFQRQRCLMAFNANAADDFAHESGFASSLQPSASAEHCCLAHNFPLRMMTSFDTDSSRRGGKRQSSNTATQQHSNTGRTQGKLQVRQMQQHQQVMELSEALTRYLSSEQPRITLSIDEDRYATVASTENIINRRVCRRIGASKSSSTVVKIVSTFVELLFVQCTYLQPRRRDASIGRIQRSSPRHPGRHIHPLCVY
jgi:hypothetical protein